MKITIIGPVYPYRGGIAHFSAMLAQAFSEVGHQIRVLSFRGSYPSLFYKGKSTFDNSHTPITFPSKRVLDFYNPITWVKAIRAIETDPPGVVLMAWWTPYWAFCYGFITRWLASKNIPVVYLVHNILPHERHFFDLPLTRWAVQKGDMMIALNPNEQQKMESLFPGKPAVTIPHPTYDVFLEGRPSKEEARRTLGLPPDKFIALFFGIVRPYKGLVHLLDAVKRCRDNDLPVLTLVAGEFWEDIRPTLNFIKEYGLERNILVVNRYIPNEEVNLYFSAADAFVAPYIGGTQSGALKIAMSFGMPIVATRLIAAGEAIENYPWIKIVPPGSGKDIAQALQDLLEHPWQVDGSWSAGWTWDDWVQEFEQRVMTIPGGVREPC